MLFILVEFVRSKLLVCGWPLHKTLLCLAIQMGRPTKYTAAAAAGCDLMSGISANSSMNSISHLGHVVAPWYQLPSWKSLLQQHLLVCHQSVHAADGVNPWLVTSPDVSPSPDSTVKDMEQSSHESDAATKHQLGALDLCWKSVGASVLPVRSSLMPQLPANISTSNVNVTGRSSEHCAQSLHTDLARHFLQCSSTSSVAEHMDHTKKHMSDAVLNLSVKSLELHCGKSSTIFSHTDSDSDSSGCTFYFIC